MRGFRYLFAGLAALVGVAPAAADVMTPVFRASVHDEPIDGTGDSFNASPFEGLLRRVDNQFFSGKEKGDILNIDSCRKVRVALRSA